MKVKKLKSLLGVLLAASMVLAACGSTQTTETKTEAPKAEESKTEEVKEEAAEAEVKADEVITITIAKQLDENAGRYGDGEDINNNPMVSLAVEKLGIKMETILLGGDAANYDTKLRLALTGSEELPDVFPVYGTQMISDMIESGQVKALDEDIENYMPDRLKAIYEQYPQTFYPVTKDGKIYGIANCPTLTDGQVMIIRQDWLDNLGLEAPTNIEEFEAVIKAFTEDDPDGNGVNDTYGFTYEGDTIYNNGWCADPVTIFSAYSGKYLPGSWQEDENGNLVYGSIQSGNRDALEKFAYWHENGWTFPEAAATGAWDAMMQFAEGKAGVFFGRAWEVASVGDVTSVDPNAVIKAYPTLRQANGEPTYQDAQINDGWMMFNKDFDNMEAFFTYYDWLYDAAFGTGDFQYGYIQGYDYDIVDGEVVFDSTLFNTPVTDPFMPGKSTVLKNSPSLDTMKHYADVVSGETPETGAQIRAAAEYVQNPAMVEGYATAYEHRSEQIPSLFNGEPTDTMKKSWEQLQTMEKQVYTNIIYGKEPIEAFDEFVEEWYAQGGEQITQEVNEWYQSVK